MKKKFLVGVIVLIILFSVTNVFAVSSNKIQPRENNIENSVENTTNSNSTNELSEEDLIPALEEELKEKQEQENKDSSNTTNNENSINENVTNTENSVNRNTANSTNTKENSTNSTNTTKNETTNKNDKEKILSDIYIAEVDNELVYEDYIIDGNVYIVSSSKIIFENCEILGNIFIIADLFELRDTEIEGSSYIGVNTVKFTNSIIKSAYIAANNIESDENTVITNDLKAVANTVNFLGEIRRDSYIQVFETSNIEYSVTIQDILPEILTKYGIILVLAIAILGGFPKFTGVNLSLKISSFFKAFFTGILEIIVIMAVAIAIMVWGFGIGYALSILILLGVILSLGKVIFIVAFALRLVKNRGKNVKTKAFIFTIFVAAVVEAIELAMILGETGFLVNLIINIVLSITGFGTLMRVIFTAKKPQNVEVPMKQEIQEEQEITPKQEVKAPELKEEKIVEHNLNLQIESVNSESSKPEIYEITGKIIKRKISPVETSEVIEERKDEEKDDENKEE